MKSSTAYNHRQRFLGWLKDIHSSARIYGLSHEAMLSRLKEKIWDDPAWKKIPAACRSYISGYGDALREEDYRYHLVWRVYLDGKYINPDDVPSGRWDKVLSDAGCHFWKGNGKYFGGNLQEETATDKVAAE